MGDQEKVVIQNLSTAQADDFGSETGDNVPEFPSLDPSVRVELARYILKGLFGLAITGVGMAYIIPPLFSLLNLIPNYQLPQQYIETIPRETLDAVKTILPPIATLVIGYYFGQNSGSKQTRNN